MPVWGSSPSDRMVWAGRPPWVVPAPRRNSGDSGGGAGTPYLFRRLLKATGLSSGLREALGAGRPDTPVAGSRSIQTDEPASFEGGGGTRGRSLSISSGM